MTLPFWPDAWNEIEPSLLILVGVVLFVVTEPASSTLGAELLLFGIAVVL
jgi:hypothetical protein